MNTAILRISSDGTPCDLVPMPGVSFGWGVRGAGSSALSHEKIRGENDL